MPICSLPMIFSVSFDSLRPERRSSILGECVLDLTHLPIGGKTSNKCKADILLNAETSIVEFIRSQTCRWFVIVPHCHTNASLRFLIQVGGR